MANAAIGLCSPAAKFYFISFGTLDNGKASVVMSPIIQCQRLNHVYSGKVALSDVNFELVAGEPIGLVGPNGAGKTTLRSILSGFYAPLPAPSGYLDTHQVLRNLSANSQRYPRMQSSIQALP